MEKFEYKTRCDVEAFKTLRLITQNGGLFLSSLHISDITGRFHHNVVRDLKRDISQLLQSLNFIRSDIKNDSILEKYLNIDEDEYTYIIKREPMGKLGRKSEVIYMNETLALNCLSRYSPLVRLLVSRVFIETNKQLLEKGTSIFDNQSINRAVYNYIVNKSRDPRSNDNDRITLRKIADEMLSEHNDLKLEYKKIVTPEVSDFRLTSGPFYSIDDFRKLYFDKLNWSNTQIEDFFTENNIINRESAMSRPLWERESLWDA